jgi:transposase-like protein
MTTRAQRVPTLLLTPVCPDCGREIELVRIEPARPGYDMRTFDCADCGYSKNVEFKIDRQVSAARLSR